MKTKKENVQSNFPSISYIMGRIDAHHRSLALHGGITSSRLVQLEERLIQLDCISNEPITLFISSGGGDVGATFRFIGLIGTLHSPIKGLVVDRAGSMAVDILQACAERCALPFADFFCHHTHHCVKFTGRDERAVRLLFEDFLYRLKTIQRRRQELYLGRMKCSLRTLNELFEQGERSDSFFFSAQRALELRLIDQIVTDFKFLPKCNKSKPN